MNSFSIGEAYGAGFSLIGRRPFAVLAWGVVGSVLQLLPTVLMLAIAGPGLMEAWGGLVAGSVSGDDPQAGLREFERAMQGMNAFQALDWLFSILAAAIMHAAIFRAMPRPEDGGVLGLKLGMDEVWQGLVHVCAMILIFIFAFLTVLVALALGGIVYLAGEAAGSPLGGWIKGIGIFAVIVACVVTIIWICLRFALAGPATYAERSFQFFESWTLTKGQSWPLLGLALLLGLTMFAIQLVLMAVLIGGLVAAGTMGSFSPEAIEAFFSRPFETWIVELAPWMIAIALIGALLNGAFYTILMAPFASVYRQLTRDQAAASAF